MHKLVTYASLLESSGALSGPPERPMLPNGRDAPICMHTLPYASILESLGGLSGALPGCPMLPYASMHPHACIRFLMHPYASMCILINVCPPFQHTCNWKGSLEVSQDDSVAINLCCFATSVGSAESCFLYPTVGSSQEVLNSLKRCSDFLTLGAMARFQDSWPVRL